MVARLVSKFKVRCSEVGTALPIRSHNLLNSWFVIYLLSEDEDRPCSNPLHTQRL
jgi:hypothetical protein